MAFSRTQPACGECVDARFPNANPTPLREDKRELETCCFCGEETRSGIYVRVDPADVDHPTLTK